MKTNSALQVLYDGRLVGTLAMTANHKAAFQYSEEWLEYGFSISPFSLPLKNQVLVPKLDELYRLGGTSGGARPKIMTTIDGEEWILNSQVLITTV